MCAILGISKLWITSITQGAKEQLNQGFRLSVKELLAPARQAPEDKRKVFHGSMQGDILTPPDTVKSSKSIIGDKQYSDMAKNLFKTPPPGYNAKAFQSPFTIPPVTTPCTMPKTFVPEYSSIRTSTIVQFIFYFGPLRSAIIF